MFTSEDGWCPVEREYLPAADDKSTKGIEVNPVSAERTLYVGKKNKLDIQYTSETKAKVSFIGIVFLLLLKIRTTFLYREETYNFSFLTHCN